MKSLPLKLKMLGVALITALFMFQMNQSPSFQSQPQRVFFHFPQIFQSNESDKGELLSWEGAIQNLTLNQDELTDDLIIQSLSQLEAEKQAILDSFRKDPCNTNDWKGRLCEFYKGLSPMINSPIVFETEIAEPLIRQLDEAVNEYNATCVGPGQTPFNPKTNCK